MMATQTGGAPGPSTGGFESVGYEYVELVLDSATAFNSSITGRSSKDTPSFFVGNGFTDVAGIKIIEATIPVSWFNIDNRIIEIATGSPMGTLYFGTNFGQQSTVIPSGNYTANQLASYLTTY